MLRKLLITLCLSAALCCVAAGVERPVNSSWGLALGSAHTIDTYLTPLRYSGWGAELTYRRAQAMKSNPERWSQNVDFGLAFDSMENPARNASMYYAGFDASYAMLWRTSLPWGVTAGIGPHLRGDIGVIYLARNGNNPASVKASVTAGARGYLQRRFTLGRMPVTLRWQSELPVTGAFFSPQYDELYYEIYLGNHSGLAHAAWWGNFFRWDNQVTADLHFSPNALRVGFSQTLLSTKVNNITSRRWGFAFILGVTNDWLTVTPGRAPSAENRKIIFAY